MHARNIRAEVPIYIEAESELPAPSPASFGAAPPFDSRSVMHAPLPRPRTVLARRQIPLPPISIWPRSLDEPAPLSSGRPVLPAPSPQSFGQPADPPAPAPAPPQPKASFNLVPETAAKDIDIRRLLLDSERADDPSGPVPAPLLRDPATTGSIQTPPLRDPAAASVPAAPPHTPAATASVPAALRAPAPAVHMPRGNGRTADDRLARG